MRFLNITDGQMSDYMGYLAYLTSIQDQLPPAAYEFAKADWHYNPSNPKCPHDAWVQEIKIREVAEGERQERRSTQIEIILLGAYHDRLFKITYPGVVAHGIHSTQSQKGYGDWLIDEVSLSESGLVVHEVIFSRDASLKIECRDIIFEEQLITAPD